MSEIPFREGIDGDTDEELTAMSELMRKSYLSMTPQELYRKRAARAKAQGKEPPSLESAKAYLEKLRESTNET